MASGPVVKALSPAQKDSLGSLNLRFFLEVEDDGISWLFGMSYLEA